MQFSSSFIVRVGFGGALLWGCQSARAVIIYHDIPDVHLAHNASSGNLSSYLDLDNDGANELQFQLFWNDASEAQTTTRVLTVPSTAGVVKLSSFPTNGAEPLVLDFAIGPTLPPPPVNTARSWGTSGNFGNTGGASTDHGWWNGAAYLGVRFAQPDGTHYGWVSMSATSSSIDIYSFAYESTPDATIAAGAVPAPASTLLLFAAPLCLRRRR